MHHTDEESQFGFGIGCAFHQRSGADLLLPLTDLSGRLCDASAFLSF